ncbi:beta-galactosidase [Paenibacillus sp. BIHB 4019]|uniref:Beta-galactosidase n=1 Tax=Paenibacillus sp. BIHB 4019 TaxID=1870819 RepID=A0A1B2DKR3_9BACL|nr:beta-galactosidase [Paenibacillus sp. BIHB 4019]ANY68285.1 beta-galactosidase [Paenibacillus sp. BIHB 4019]
MSSKFPPISSKIPQMLHGADYNPDQWLKYPHILEEDIRLMKLSHSNVMSVGIFGWVALEPEEGVFTFEWMDQLLDRFAANGIYALLATPSGARPAWMSSKYPEVLRVDENGIRNLHGARHNHCFSSPVYREKVQIMNTKLAERYSSHPAVIGWHISNEFGGECHCDLCAEAFRGWLQQRYGTLEALNDAWWTTFWSHTYTDWSQVDTPTRRGERAVHGMNVDWMRFVTDQTVDFCRKEMEPLRAINPELPITTNFMLDFEGLNYWKFADMLDMISWDAYPTWHSLESDSELAAWIGFNHDIFRSLKGGKPFMLMESTPSMTNWQPVSKLKKPGMHLLSSMQAVAHGSDTVQYFQWRKSRGSSEKLHGSVVDHVGHEHTRVFKDVTDVGHALTKLEDVVGTSVKPEVAIIYDWENRWAVKDSQGPRNCGIHYEETARKHYRPFWELGIPVDIIDSECALNSYKIVIAPMLYMVRPGVGEAIEKFVENGGTFIATYWTGIVNESDLCFLTGFPGPLRKTLGIWSEEIDSLHDGETNRVVMSEGNALGLSGEYEAHELCDLIHLEGAEALAVYGEDFYAGRPALTVNRLGKGKAYYVASRNKEPFFTDFFKTLVEQEGIRKVLDTELPEGVTAQLRSDGESDYVFVSNFTPQEQQVVLDSHSYEDVLNGGQAESALTLAAYDVRILKRKSR